MNLLLVEDDEILGTLVKQTLEGKQYQVDLTEFGKDGIEKALTNSYACIVLDLGLPDIDGLEVCKSVREKGIQTPVLILSAYDNINRKVDGLQYGADDYLTKPFENQELLARIEALIRRSQIGKEREILKWKELELNLISRTFFVNGAKVNLTNNEFDLMAYFLKNPDRTISPEELAGEVWNLKFDRKTNYVNVYLSYIRKKIKEHSSKKYFITIRKKGFRLGPDN